MKILLYIKIQIIRKNSHSAHRRYRCCSDSTKHLQMYSSLSLLRKIPYETNMLAEYCFGKQFVSRKVLKKKLKFLLAWLLLSASARVSVLHASSSSEVTVENRTMRTRKPGWWEAWQHFGTEELVSNQFQSDRNMIIYSIEQRSNFPQAKVFACPEGYFYRGEWKRGKRKLQFQIKTIWGMLPPNTTSSENQLIYKWVLSF